MDPDTAESAMTTPTRPHGPYVPEGEGTGAVMSATRKPVLRTSYISRVATSQGSQGSQGKVREIVVVWKSQGKVREFKV